MHKQAKLVSCLWQNTVECKWKDFRAEDEGSNKEREQLKSLEEDQRGEFQPSEALTDLTQSRYFFHFDYRQSNAESKSCSPRKPLCI